MLENYFDSPVTLERLRSGLAGPFIEDFAEGLRRAGYSRSTIRGHLGASAHLGHWAQEKGLTSTDLNEEVGRVFWRHLSNCKCPCHPGKYRNQAVASVRLFLSHLRQTAIIPPPLVETSKAQERPLLSDFCQWMRQHRGIRESTLHYYSRVIRKLIDHVDGQPSRLNADTLRSFVLDQTRNHSTHPKEVTTALHTFVRYLIAEGKCPPALEGAVPTVAQWRLSTLPRYLPAPQIESVIAACNASTPNGSRDRALVLFMARLGLRADDVVRLELEDIDWRKATVRLSGKGRREVRLPLTQEIGDAILGYLRHGRPAATSGRLFLRTIAPAQPFSDSSAVSKIVTRAITRAGINTPLKGAHVLRHSAATAMLQEGVSLQEISSILRHRSLETTAYYAKVDLSLLQQVVQPWPEVMPC